MTEDRPTENRIEDTPAEGDVNSPGLLPALSRQTLPPVSRLGLDARKSSLGDYVGQKIGVLRERSGRFVEGLMGHLDNTLSRVSRLSAMLPDRQTAGQERALAPPMWQRMLDLTWFQRRRKQKNNRIYRSVTDTESEFSTGESREDSLS